jgi:hypothetical protein
MIDDVALSRQRIADLLGRNVRQSLEWRAISEVQAEVNLEEEARNETEILS